MIQVSESRFPTNFYFIDFSWSGINADKLRAWNNGFQKTHSVYMFLLMLLVLLYNNLKKLWIIKYILHDSIDHAKLNASASWYMEKNPEKSRLRTKSFQNLK